MAGNRDCAGFDRTTFLNVDLDVGSREDLASLADALVPELIVLHVGRVGRAYRASFELRTQPKTPDGAIRRLVAAVGTLPARQRALWKRAKTRDLNIGIQAADEPMCSEFPLNPLTVKMVSRIGARIVITVYAAAHNA
jgi:hypothetical protein